ncbi:hypothetical protein H4R20_000692 [Coemansia guatemalensis]|uniref:Importin N-terminal domain-containing protein n=1 Tax=Coemansia guatemalensis TaxID=2761395 RepID=A0A9W8I0L7_9FUNG|nr:hypothetical protein H4R20_000692 [Coemansia guatemalensis]
MALEDIDVQSFVQALGVPTQEALAALEQIQREPAAWQLAFDLLGSDNANCRFFGAHTLQTKIGRDWETLDDERRQALRYELIRVVVESSAGPQNVLSKLNQGLAMYALRTVPDEWENFLPTAMEAIRQRGRETGKGAGQAEMAIVELLTQFPEELNRTAIASARHGRLVQDVKAAVPAVLQMLTGVACGEEAWQAELAPVQRGAWRTRAWRGVQQWLQFGVAGDEQFVGLLALTLRRLQALATQRAAGADDAEEEEEAAAAAVVEDMVGNVRMATQFGRSVGTAAVEQLGQPWARQAALGDGEAATAWAGVLAAFGETHAEFLVERAGSDACVDAYLQTMVGLTRMPGTAGVDEQVSAQALGVWYAVQEAAEDGEGRAAVAAVLSDVAQGLVAKSAFPAAEAWAAAGREGRERFHAFRREAGDGLLNAYYALRGALVGALADEAGRRMAGLTLDAWQDAEAALFALRSVGEAAAADAAGAAERAGELSGEGAAHDSPAAAAAHLSRFFTPEMVGSQFVAVLQTEWGVAATKAAVVALVGAYAEWWRAQPQLLPAAVACVATALAQPPLVQPAAAALRRICDACRTPLAAVADDLAVLARDVAGAAAVPPREQQRVVEAVAEVVAAVPPPALPPTLAPLAAALAASITTAAAQVNMLPAGDERSDAVAALGDRLRVVDALARGLQTPDDVEARALAGDADALAALTFAAQSYADPALCDCRAALLHALQRVPLADVALLECVLAIVASATRRGPHALAFAFADAVALVEAGWDGCWEGSWGERLDGRWDERCPPLLRSVAQLATVFAEPAAWHGAPPDAPRVLAALVARAVDVTCAGLEREAPAAAVACERQPLVCEGLLELGARVVLPRPALLACLPHACVAQLCTLAKHALAVPSRLALRPASLFATTLTRLAAAAPPADPLRTLWAEYAPVWLRATLAAIGGTHPRSLLPVLAELLFAFVRHHPADARRCLADLLATEDFPSPHADAAAKRQLLQLLATRSLVRAKAAVADFSARCRNLDAS